MTSRRPHPGWTFAIVSVALFMVVLDNLVVTTALPSIRSDLGGGVQALEWTVNAYTLTFAVLLLSGAALGDRFGRRRMFTIGLGIFTLSSAAAALAPSIGALIAARALQGAGAAIVTPLTLTLLSEAFPPERRGLALGAWSGISGLGVALGPVVGGAVVEGISWHWIFWLNVPIGLAILPFAALRLTESFGPAKELDLPGLALGGLGLLGVVYGIVRGNELGWTAPTIMASLGVGRRAAGRLRRLGAARQAPDAADALLPLARLRRVQRRQPRDVLRRLRLDLPAGPVLPGHAGAVAAGGGHPHAPVDRHADAHRAGRRAAIGPDRLAPADGRRPVAAGDRDRVAGQRVDRDRRLLGAGDPVHPRRHRHGARVRADRQRRAERGAPRGGRPGLRRDERDPRGRRRARHRRAGERVQRATAPTPRRRRSRTA